MNHDKNCMCVKPPNYIQLLLKQRIVSNRISNFSALYVYIVQLFFIYIIKPEFSEFYTKFTTVTRITRLPHRLRYYLITSSYDNIFFKTNY